MLDIIFIILVFLAILLLFYAISERGIAFTLMDSVLWLILGVLLLQGIEIPYEMFNATSGKIQTGMHNIYGATGNLEPISYLFMGIGTIMFILFISFILETLYDVKKLKP